MEVSSIINNLKLFGGPAVIKNNQKVVDFASLTIVRLLVALGLLFE